MKTRFLFFVLLLACCRTGTAQTLTTPLQPGYNTPEFLEMLRVSVAHPDTVAAVDPTPQPTYLKLAYRSPEVGLKNRWDLWLSPDGQLACVSLRGTVNHPVSWLENFYAGMVPATGSLHLSDSTTFRYQLAADSKATVHVGWLIGVASLAPTIVEQLKQLHARGVRQVLIAGHSQGAALAILLRSYLYYLAQQGGLPNDFVFKSYCSAAPKPGNLYYAYDYETITRGGWGFTIVNTADWVPETPFSLQTLTDFNPVNPFVGIKPILRKQKLGARLAGGYLYRKLDRSSRKAQRRFTKFLGSLAGKQVRNTLPQYRPPAYAPVENFQRAGTPIVLQPLEAYYQKFPNDPNRIFVHHLPFAYYSLVQGLGR